MMLEMVSTYFTICYHVKVYFRVLPGVARKLGAFEL